MSVATAIFRKRSARAYASVRERLGLVTATLAEDIAGMRVVQAFTRERANTRNFREVTERYREANMQTVVLNGLYFPFVDLLSTVALAVVLGYGGYLYFEGAITLGTLFAFMLYLPNFFDPVQQLSQLYNTFLSATAALDKIMDVLDEEPEVTDRPGRSSCRPSRATSRFEGVRFGYGDGPEVLHGIDLDVPAGRPSRSSATRAPASRRSPSCSRASTTRARGGSRSTAHDLRDVTQASLRRQLGIVPQEGFLFAGTVRDNIAFGRPDASPEDVVRAAETVGAHDFILRLEDGYETDLQERGTPPLARPAPARRVRPRAARRPAHPDPRRGDLVRRHRHRAQDRAGAAARCSPTGPRSSSRTGSRRSATPT